jgi:hypothetical protein
MKQMLNLTPSNIKKWAYKKSDPEVPTQFEEINVVVKYGELFLTLAADQTCPKRAPILSCLYSLIGKSASKHLNSDMSLINSLLDKAATYQDTVILNWVARSRAILLDMRKYDYVEWCEGGFVRKDLN